MYFLMNKFYKFINTLNNLLIFHLRTLRKTNLNKHNKYLQISNFKGYNYNKANHFRSETNFNPHTLNSFTNCCKSYRLNCSFRKMFLYRIFLLSIYKHPEDFLPIGETNYKLYNRFLQDLRKICNLNDKEKIRLQLSKSKQYKKVNFLEGIKDKYQENNSLYQLHINKEKRYSLIRKS